MIAAVSLASPHLPLMYGWDPNLGYGLAYFVGFAVVLLAWFTWCAVVMGKAPTNWVVRLAANGIYLCYRGFLNGDYPGISVAACIPSGAIAWIGPVTEESSYIDNEGSTIFVTHRRLDIKLRGADLDGFKQHVTRERKR